MYVLFNRWLWVAAVLALPSTQPAVADSHVGKQVSAIHSPDTRPCTFFKLDGVTQADPVVPGTHGLPFHRAMWVMTKL